MLLLHVTVHSFALRLAIFRYNYKRTPEKEGYEYIYKDNHRHVFIRDTQICGRNIFYPTNPRLHFLR
jgi:hypothetical protein